MKKTDFFLGYKMHVLYTKINATGVGVQISKKSKKMQIHRKNGDIFFEKMDFFLGYKKHVLYTKKNAITMVYLIPQNVTKKNATKIFKNYSKKSDFFS